MLALLIAALGVISTAIADAPDLALSFDGSRLEISSIPPDAPASIELTSDDAIPIVWNRRDVRRAELPLIVNPGVVDPVVLTVLKQPRSIVIEGRHVPQVQIDPAAYEKLATWRPTSSPADRQTTLLLAVAMGTTLLLASLAGRKAAITVAIVALAWCAGLTLVAHDRATLVEQVDDGRTTWFLAESPQTIRVAIPPGETAVPVVEASEQLPGLQPRAVVDRSGTVLELNLPAGGKVGVARALAGR